ncbi:MAG: NADH-quinone oxidoreductase subunit J [Hydrogenibacillus sp.]|nr:NADH-quinone oxidoreductase subunit J [Hydrogenibacillus sp.]
MAANLVVFLIVAAFVLIGGMVMLTETRVLHMAFAVALSFLGIAAFFFLLGAEFLGVMQVIVYTGAVTTLAVFGIMLTKHDAEDPPANPNRWHRLLSLFVSAALFAIFFYALIRTPLYTPVERETPISAAEIGAHLFSGQYVLAFELIGVLLLAALIGSVVLAKEDAPDRAKEDRR